MAKSVTTDIMFFDILQPLHPLAYALRIARTHTFSLIDIGIDMSD